MYFAQCRLCNEVCRAYDGYEAISKSRLHLEEAAKQKPELLNTTLYVRILCNLGITLTALERYDEAEIFHKQAIEHCKRLGMEEECSMGNLLQNLGSCYLWSGQLQKAEKVLNEALHQSNANKEGAMYTFGNLHLRLKRYDKAFELHSEVLEVYLKAIGVNHPTTADSWHKVGTIFAMAEFSGYNLEKAE
jgi:tetratricopeptide (TPR) repeat protein